MPDPTPDPTLPGAGSASASPTAAALTVAVVAPAASAVRNVTVTPAVVAMAVSVPSPTVQRGARATPAAAELSVPAPAPMAFAGGQESAQVTVPAATMTVAVPAPSISLGTPSTDRLRTIVTRYQDRTISGGALARYRIHDPNDRLDYRFDWGERDYLNRSWLGDDTIASAEVFASDPAVLLTGKAIASDGKSVVIFVSGGQLGGQASVTCRITTAEGRQADRTAWFKFRNK